MIAFAVLLARARMYARSAGACDCNTAAFSALGVFRDMIYAL